jgi:GNAT superfamily N-acetyltransferase
VIDVRPATPADVPRIDALIAKSARALLAPYYKSSQIESALGTVFGVDSSLIADGTFFVATVKEHIVGCGGWSKRKTPFGSDHAHERDDTPLDPAQDRAKVRAFFVDPGWARRGVGRRILRACEQAAIAAGFSRFELVATRGGEPLYHALGYRAVERFDVPLPNGERLAVVRMIK